MIEFTMPSLGADMDEGTLQQWLVKPGDPVSRGQIVAVVETAKAAVEVECWHAGIVDELLVPVGETVSVGTALATLRAQDEVAPPRKAPRTSRPKRVKQQTTKPPAPAVAATRTAAHRRWVSPAARRLASQLTVDTDVVTGTGPGGAVTLRDIEVAAAAVPNAAPAAVPHAAPAAAPKSAPAAETGAAERAAAMRTSIAAAMSRSKREIPHYYLAQEIRLDAAVRWLAERNAGRPITERVLLAALQLKAIALATRRYGDFNGFWRENRFVAGTGTHVGVAISLRGGGLVAPAIHDVAEKNIDELMSDLTDLVTRARAGSLRSSEMSDPTITVTNLGEKGVDTVFGVIYPPQVALVGFGKPAQIVSAIDGGIRVVSAVQTTLAADHRASDGHRGAQFLASIDELLQQPENLEK